MIILGIETATDACSAALYCNGEIFQKCEIAPRRHAELMLAMINELLKENDLALADLDAVAFGHGPGSFMGVRIATGIAQGLAFAIDRPVIPVSTLQALAEVAYQKNPAERIISAWDARMDEVYWGLYQRVGELMQSVQPDQLSRADAITVPNEPEQWLAVGNAWSAYAGSFDSHLEKSIQVLDTGIYPQAQGVVRVAAVKYQQGQTNSAEHVEPVYLRNRVAWKPGERREK